MRIEEPLKYFGSAAKAAEAIGYARMCFSYWRHKNGGVVSERAAMLFVKASNGALQLGMEDYAEDKPKQAA